MVRSGLDVLTNEKSALIRGRRLGVLCHHASFTSSLEFAVTALRRAGGTVVRLLGPEHGPWGTAQDMVSVDGGEDPWTGLEMVSLYGSNLESLRPDPAVLDGLDALVIDLQDVGARYYTYACTAALAAEVAMEVGVEPIVCDRPNPIGGDAVEGNILKPECASFVGMYPVPNRHGLTFAEVVRAYISNDVPVVEMEGWERHMWYDQTGLPWIPPSPNMPTLTTAALYPGLCLIEGTEVSEGRGTTTPFELIGAPFINPFELASALNALPMAGVQARPHVFQPMFQKYQGQVCGGVQLIVANRHQMKPLRLGIQILCTLRALYPEQFKWRSETYEFVSDRLAIDLLLGEFGLSTLIDEGASWREVCAGFATAEATWLEERREYLIYD